MEQTQQLAKVESTQAQQLSGEQRIPLTYEEYLTRFEDSTHVEWVNGEAIIFMAPNTRHQRIIRYLTVLLGMFLQVYRYGEILQAPFAMRIHPNGNVREPDILYVANEHANRVDEQRLNGPADLIIEIISTDSVARDRSDKFYEYQAGGVREYWLIDPRPGFSRTDFWVLDEDGRYRSVLVGEDGYYTSTVLPNFKLNVNSLLADQLPDPLKALAEIVGVDVLLRAMGHE